MVSPERPFGQGGQFDAEHGVGVLDRLCHRTGKSLFEQGSAGGPVQAAADAEEDGPRCLVVAACVCLERGPGLLEDGFAAGHREQPRLQQGQRVHGVGVVECELGGGVRAGGVAGDVGARQAEVVKECRGVGGVVGDGHWRRGGAAAGPTPLVVADQLVAVSQCRFGQQRQESVGEDGADEQHRFARSDHLVFQLDAVDRCAVHGSSVRAAWVGGVSWFLPVCVSETVTAVTLTVTAPVGHRAGPAPSRSGTKLVGQGCRARMGRRAVSEGAGRGLVERARSAAARGGWEQAFDLLVEADADGLLAPADLPVLGEVAYAAGHLDVHPGVGASARRGHAGR